MTLYSFHSLLSKIFPGGDDQARRLPPSWGRCDQATSTRIAVMRGQIYGTSY
jgi:hypothetical protein